jgi:hypothetical protein
MIVGIGTLFGLVAILGMFLRAFLASSPSVQAAIIAGFVTIIGSVITIVFSARNQKRREIEAEHRKQKAEMYDSFMEMWFDNLLKEKTGAESVTESDLLVKMIGFTRKMTVWGSDEVLREFIRFREAVTQQTDAPMESLILLENLLFAMRRDLGHDNKNLNQTDLLRLFINDLDHETQNHISHAINVEIKNEEKVTSRSTSVTTDITEPETLRVRT